MNKPEYIQDLEKRIDKLELYQKGQRQAMDDIMVEQADNKRMLTQIHTCLMGTEYDKNGGLVTDVKKLKADVKSLKNWKIRIVAVGSTISAILGGLFTLFATRVNGIKDLLK